MEQLFSFNIDQLGRNLLVRKIQVAHDSKAAILAVDEAHEDRNILVLVQKDESGTWNKDVLGDFPNPGFVRDIGIRSEHLLACETDWIALALANEEGSDTRLLLWGQEGTEQKKLHLSGSLGTRVTLAGLAFQHPFIILGLRETRRQEKALINVYKLESGANYSEGAGALLMRRVSLPNLDFSPFETRIISNCHFLGFILQTWREKIVHLFELKDLLSEDISDEQTWTRKICLPCDSPRGEWGHLNIDMNTTSLVYADVTYFDNYDREETDVDTNVQKKDFWMGRNSTREYE